MQNRVSASAPGIGFLDTRYVNVGGDTMTGELKSLVSGTILGDETVVNPTFTTDTGWTHDSEWTLNDGALYSGAATPSSHLLEQTITIPSTGYYFIEFTCDTIAKYVDYNLAGVSKRLFFDGGTPGVAYGSVRNVDSQYLKAGAKLLSISPSSMAGAKLTLVSVRKVTTPSVSNFTALNPDGLGGFEIRAGGNSSNNIFIGKNTGQYEYKGFNNVIIGINAAPFLVSGGGNVVIGYGAGYDLINNSRTTLVGYTAGANLASGDSNSFFGAASGVTAISASYCTYLGSYSGNSALNNAVSNTGVGFYSLRVATGSYSTAVGSYAGQYDGGFSTYLGASAGVNNTGTKNNLIGYFSGSKGDGLGNVMIGHRAGASYTGDYSVIIGHDAAYSKLDGTHQLIIAVTDTTTPLIHGSFNGALGFGLKINNPTSTSVAQIIKAATSQTANIQEWQNSSGTKQVYIDSSFCLNLGNVGANNYGLLNAVRTNTATGQSAISAVYTNSGAYGDNYGLLFYSYSRNTSGTAARTFSSFYQIIHDKAGTVTNLGQFLLRSQVSDGVITNWRQFYGEIYSQSGGAIETAQFIYIPSLNKTGGTLTNQYGLYIENQNQATTLNYAIYTNEGLVRFGDKVIFTQTDGNEYIDSEADGYLTVGATSSVLINSLAYGSMYGDDVGLTVTIASAGVYYQVPTGLSAGSCNGFTFADSGLTCTVAGKYKVDWSMSMDCAAAGQYIEGAVMINSTGQMNTVGAAELITANKQVCTGGSGIITLAVNDVVYLCVENETGTNNIVVEHANLSLVRVGN